MQNHKNHHRDPANDVAKESGGHCSRKHLKTWFRTSCLTEGGVLVLVWCGFLHLDVLLDVLF